MILVTGASGTVGGEVVGALLHAQEPVRAMTRAANPSGLPAGVETVQGDLDRPETLTGPLDGVQAVFLLAGFPDMDGVLGRVERAGVQRIVLLSSGAVVGGEESNAVTRYNMDSEAAVRESGVPWTILRPSGFMANALRWLPQLRDGDVVRAPFADVAVAAIDPADIGAVAATTLTGAGHGGAAYRLTGPEPMCPAEQVAVLAEVLDRDLRFEGQPDDEARAEMSKAMPEPYVDAFFRYYADGTYDDSQVHGTVQELLGRPPRTFRQWAVDHAGAFR
jgi:uncharacterized protein YbjT (DUF2867 family)